MLVELCAGDYVMMIILWNGVDGIFKTSTCCDKNHHMDNVWNFLNWNIDKKKIHSLFQ